MRRRPPAAALVVAALAALIGGCGDDSRAGPPTGEDNPTVRPDVRPGEDDPSLTDEGRDLGDLGDLGVLVIGDSLTNGARLFGDLGDRLDRAGFAELRIIAEDGETTAWGIAEIEELEEVPEVVVVELGTNPDEDTDGFAEEVATMVAALEVRGAEHIAWLTPAHGRDDRYEAKADILRSTPGIDLVADWASVAREDPRRLAADGYHPTEAGYTELARFLVVTARDVARQGT